MVQQTIAGMDPEKVLVIETRGDIVNFAQAIKKIPGLEWMGEVILRELKPDEDFFIEDNPDKEIGGQLYLVMTDHAALVQMVSLWENSQNDSWIWERKYARFRDLFQHLKTIRFWNVEDRLSEAGILAEWQNVVTNHPDQIERFEIELWYRNSEEKRRVSQQSVSELVQQSGGRVINQSILSPISYHSLLVEVPVSAIQKIFDHSDTKLVECDNIMFFKPVGQMAAGRRAVDGDLPEIELPLIEDLPLPTGEPIIALFDGLPLEHHSLLSGRLMIDDPDQLAEAYGSPMEQYHGTGMASLIVHGDLNGGIHPLSRKVYVRPIMKPDPDSPPQYRTEVMAEENELGIDLIHRAVRRLFESENGEEPIAPNIKVINLSIGYPNRLFTRSMSPLARLLDILSDRYNVLFIISAGNCIDPYITTLLNREDFDGLSRSQLEEIVVNTLYSDMRNRKILSPSESINGLTIGSLHQDNATLNPDDPRIDLYENLLPSTCSPFGSGYQRSVKPDLVFSGGRVLYHKPLPQEHNITFRPYCQTQRGPGNQVATPGRVPGVLTQTTFEYGTSNSAALVSRSAGICYDSLLKIFEDQSTDVQYEPYIVPLLKAMIVHGCSWGDMKERLHTILADHTDEDSINSWICRWAGYGVPDINKVLECREGRATLLGFGQLIHDQAHMFHLPLPISLGGQSVRRRLTVTLAWISPVASSTQKYRMANLWFDLNKEDSTSLSLGRKEVPWQTVRRGTVQHEIFEGNRTILPLSDEDSIEIRVNCKKDAGKLTSPIKYGLVASLEVAEGMDIPIYDEIRTRIAPVIQIRSGAQQNT
jgi:hypothetical protein